MTNPELISFYDGHSRLNVRAKRDDELLVEIQYRKTSPYNCGAYWRVRVASMTSKAGWNADDLWITSGGYAEEGFDHQGVWIKTDRDGVGKMLAKCFRTGHISQTTMTLMAAAIDDPMLKSKGNTGLDAGAGWVKMIDGEAKWELWPEPKYDPYDG
ncbi:MAG: hypothetical protein CMB34_06775 [Euryarchaeota archaeon]|nr:hypothetical protein [Euryarchaeota archaeon]